jgi:hypothetical protein
VFTHRNIDNMALPKLKYGDYPEVKGLAIVEKPIEWITTAEASVIMGITPQAVQRLCRKQGIHCRKHGRDWMVDKAAAENYNPTKTGRPKTKRES